MIKLNSLLCKTHCESRVSCLHPELSQNPDAVAELGGLVQHVLAVHGALSDGEDVATLKFVGDCIC